MDSIRRQGLPGRRGRGRGHDRVTPQPVVQVPVQLSSSSDDDSDEDVLKLLRQQSKGNKPSTDQKPGSNIPGRAAASGSVAIGQTSEDSLSRTTRLAVEVPEVKIVPISPASKVSDSTDSDEEDDFISTFRQLHPNSASVKLMDASPSSSSLGGKASSSVSSLDESIRDMFPVDVGIVSRKTLVSPPLLSSSSSSSLNLKDTASSTSDDFQEMERSVVVRRGQHGRLVPIVANYIKMKVSRTEGIYEYHVDFEPLIGSKRLRHMMVRKSIENNLGNNIFSFDGSKLYLPIKLPHKITTFQVNHPKIPETDFQVRVKFVKQNSPDTCIHFFNVLLRRVMHILGLIEMNRNFFDHENIFDLPIHKLQIWPGYVTAIDYQEGGLMLCCDASFRVLRTDTLHEALTRFMSCNRLNFQDNFKDYVLGKIVLTRYNKMHYKIDDVDWTATPRSTFTQVVDGIERNVSFIDYYKHNYGISIRDTDQPMLVTRGKFKRQINDLGPPPLILLVPELCFVTGLSEDITSDYRIMKDIAQHTRLSPEARHQALQDFLDNARSNEKAAKVFRDWGLELESGAVSIEGRVISAPPITINEKVELIPVNGDFSSDLKKNRIYDPVHISHWLLLCTPQDDQKAKRLMSSYRSVTQPLGITYRGDGQLIYVGKRGRPEDYRDALEDNIKPGFTQFVVVIIPSRRDDLYQVVKRVCIPEVPIPSQVIRSTTLSNEMKIRSVMQNVALQVNCKLGGSLWTIKIPLPERIMFVGMDVYHDPKKRQASVTAVVASLNRTHTKFYSRVIFQNIQQESITSLRPVLVDTLTEFYRENEAFPDRVIVFRDGVGDGQLEMTRLTEVQQFLDSFKDVNIKPKFTFCVVQKRINSRFYVQHGTHLKNPEPGTVVDNTVTRRYHFDFFLVSQLIRQGTASPSHYIVLHDDSTISPDMMQKFAYATSYMYFNWAGSIQVPAFCQYAHKLAGLVGQHLGVEPSPELAKLLYYL